MNAAYVEMLENLQKFKEDWPEYEGQLAESHIEQFDALCVIKKEVLDLSDTADKLGGILIAQSSKFETQKKHLDEISKIIRLFKEHGARP